MHELAAVMGHGPLLGHGRAKSGCMSQVVVSDMSSFQISTDVHTSICGLFLRLC